MAKNDFQYGGWNYYILQCGMWLWDDMPWKRISAVFDFRSPVMGSLKRSCTTSYRSSIDTIALNCLVFEKIALLHFGDRQTVRQMDSIDALSRSCCRERRLNIQFDSIQFISVAGS